MEKLKLKHDHTLTNILKVFIFSIFLMLPIFTWIPTAFYYGFNEHATNPSTTDVQINYKYQSNTINTNDDLITGNIYDFNVNGLALNEVVLDELDITFIKVYSYDFRYLNMETDEIIADAEGTGEISIHCFITDYDFTLTFYANDDSNYFCTIVSQDNDIFSLHAIVVLENQPELAGNFLTYTDYNEIESVDVVESDGISNAMYKSWQDIWTQPLFNWTGNNNFEFTINAFTSVFGITPQSYITNYINYLLTLTAIYIVFDIIIMVFVKLTHIFGNE